MKVYLIAPKNPASFWTFDRVLPSLGKRCVFPNLALPTVAGLTPPGHEVVLCDENVEPVDFDTDADVVGITGFVVHKRRMFELAEAFRRRGKLVVAGGPFATLCPEELRGKVDVLVVGEAEYTWPQFVRDYDAGAWRAEYRQEEKPSMLDSPLPRFELLKAARYRSMAIQFARGCPYNCEFCDIIVMYGRPPRTKSVAPGAWPRWKAIHPLGGAQHSSVGGQQLSSGKKKGAQGRLLVTLYPPGQGAAAGYPHPSSLTEESALKPGAQKQMRPPLPLR